MVDLDPERLRVGFAELHQARLWHFLDRRPDELLVCRSDRWIAVVSFHRSRLHRTGTSMQAEQSTDVCLPDAEAFGELAMGPLAAFRCIDHG